MGRPGVHLESTSPRDITEARAPKFACVYRIPKEDHMNMKARLASVPVWGVGIVLLSILIAGCGVSKSKYLDVTKKADQLTAQNKQLTDSLASVHQSMAQLESDKAAVESHAKELEAGQQQLQAQLEQQQKEVAQVKATYEGLVGHLQSEVSSGKVEIQQVRDGISVSLAQDILFKSGSADLDKTGSQLLLKVAGDLKASPFQILVTGHTDNQKIGAQLASRYPTNWELGGARAATIVRLFEKSGIDKARLAAVSFADSRPREPNDTPAGRAKNRRIEIRLRPATEGQSASN
jgi:chemotaxis protein MotB